MFQSFNVLPTNPEISALIEEMSEKIIGLNELMNFTTFIPTYSMLTNDNVKSYKTLKTVENLSF